MPGLIACNRRWEIGTDDLMFPAVLEIILYVPWFVTSLLLYVSDLKELQCEGVDLLHTYLQGLLVILGIALLLDIYIGYISAQGTIYEEYPRRHVIKFLYARIILIILEFAWNVLGAIWNFFVEDHHCETYRIAILLEISVVCGWTFLGLKFFFIYLTYDPLGAPKYCKAASEILDGNATDWTDSYAQKKLKLWKQRLKCLCYCCCCWFCIRNDQNTKDAINNVSQVTAYMWGDCDLVPSDIASGLVLMRQEGLKEHRKQAADLQKCSTVASMSEDDKPLTCFPPPSTPEWMNLELACHYINFTRGVFGWPLLMYTNMSHGICEMWNDMKCCFCVRKPPHIVADNCCRCNTAALQKLVGLNQSDLIYVSFHDYVYQVPFYVALDHKTSSIVVVLRGSMSIDDCLTDLSGGFDVLTADGCPQDTMCHHGMLQASLYIKTKLIDEKIIQMAFNECPNYTLVLTGHSLGAAVAIILAFLLRPIYPTLKCFAFGTPAVVTSNALKYSEDFVFSVIYGDDIIPTLGVRGGEGLALDMMKCLSQSKQPKYRILLGCCFLSESSTVPVTARHQSKPTTPTANGNVDTYAELEKFQKYVMNKTFPNLKTKAPQLFVPGKILHIGITPAGFRLRWLSPDYYQKVIYRPKMFWHHFPHLLQEVLDQFSRDPSLMHSCLVHS